MPDFPAVLHEFLRVDDPQIRKNAAVALAVWGSAESILELVGLALDDRDETVRQRAEKEILSLDDISIKHAIDALLLRVNISERAPNLLGLPERAGKERLEDPKALEAYAMLGRLASTGFPVPPPAQPRVTRIKLAFQLHRRLNPDLGWRFWKRTGLTAVVAASVFTFLTISYFSLSGLIRSTDLFGPGWTLATIFAVVTVWRSNPTSLHSDFAAGLTSEVGAIAIAAFAIIAPITVVTAIEKAEWTTFVTTTVFGVTTLVVVRLGTIIGDGLVRSKGWNRAVSTLVGGSAGFLFGALLLHFAFIRTRGNIGHFWPATVPILFTCAAAFAKIDRREPSSSPPFGNESRLVSGVIVGLVFLLLCLGIVPAEWLPESTIASQHCSSPSFQKPMLEPVLEVPKAQCVVLEAGESMAVDLINRDLTENENTVPRYAVSVTLAGESLKYKERKLHWRKSATEKAEYNVEVLPMENIDPFSEFMNKVYRVVMPRLGLAPYRLAIRPSGSLELKIERPVNDRELKKAVIAVLMKMPVPKDLVVNIHEGVVSVTGTVPSSEKLQQFKDTALKELVKIEGVESFELEKIAADTAMKPQLNIVR